MQVAKRKDFRRIIILGQGCGRVKTAGLVIE